MKPDEFLNVIVKRHTVRRFKAEPPPEADVAKLLEAAARAPYGGGSPPWKFVFTGDRAQIEKVGAALKAHQPDATEEFGAYFVHAPVLIAAAWKPICYPAREPPADLNDPQAWPKYREDITVGLLSVGHAIENILLAATALGLGAGYIGPSHGEFGFEEILSVEPPYRVCALIPIGYPAEG